MWTNLSLKTFECLIYAGAASKNHPLKLISKTFSS